MWKYLTDHEKRMLDLLDSELTEASLIEVSAFHEKQIRFMQHERLVALFMLLCLGFAVLTHQFFAYALTFILIGLTSAYIIHYFRLENGVQRWYLISNRLDKLLRSTKT
jgi:hypothetical protein